ncbi:MAG: MBL fold metallo-hydrolase [Bacteroides sp.]|nr:MBL fold metallo-hydrolase [Eubacterium sp.]MCM1418589.1 MBL fold metallo-hydrolase [Roseburia sp.]MCM1462643.1 MBL fold metallo-hydrolase [Bacteroides sp.]
MFEIFTLTLPPLGTNCYLVKTGEKSGLAIDPAADADKILEKAAENGFAIEKILLTHGHFDHTGAVNALVEKTGAKVYLHAADEPLLKDANKALAYFCPEIPFEEKRADVLLADGDTVEQDELTFRVLHTPGHTAGSVCFLLDAPDGEKLMFAGDTIFKDSIGRSDGYSGDHIVQRETLERLKALPDDYTILSGHGEPTTLFIEKRYNPFLSDF